MSVLRVERLTKHFPAREGLLGRASVHAVDDVSFEIREGETFGLVGESGSGKTTLGRCILRLVEPTSGRIWFEGQDITALRGGALRKVRLRIQAVFQNPTGSLNPRMRAGAAIAEPLRVHGGLSREEAEAQVPKLLARVGLHQEVAGKFPHELSGGQCQRLAIARALAVEPKFIVLDEPTSSLDVSVQAQIINLLKDLQRDLGLTVVMVTHDLDTLGVLSNRVAALAESRLVALGPLEVVQAVDHPFIREYFASERGRLPSP